MKRYIFLSLLFFSVSCSSTEKQEQSNEKVVLMQAISDSDIKTVKKLLNKGIDCNFIFNSGTPLCNAILSEDIAMIKLILADNKININYQDGNGETPLIISIHSVFKDNIVRLLLKKGADVNLKDNRGAHALMYAGTNKSIDVCQLILIKKAKINETDNEGFTALDYLITKRKSLDGLPIIVDKKNIGPSIVKKYDDKIKFFRKNGGKTGEELKAERKEI